MIAVNNVGSVKGTFRGGGGHRRQAGSAVLVEAVHHGEAFPAEVLLSGRRLRRRHEMPRPRGVRSDDAVLQACTEGKSQLHSKSTCAATCVGRERPRTKPLEML